MQTAVFWKLQSGASREMHSSATEEPVATTSGGTMSTYRILRRTMLLSYWINTSLSGSKRQVPNLFGTSWEGGQERNSTITQTHGKGGSKGGRDTWALPCAVITQELGEKLYQHVKEKWQQPGWSLPKWEEAKECKMSHCSSKVTSRKMPSMLSL